MPADPIYQALMAQIQSVQLELKELRAMVSGGGRRAARIPHVVRVNSVLTPVGGSGDPPRAHRGPAQIVTGELTGDGAYTVDLIQRTSHQSWLPKYAQDVTVLPLNHFQFGCCTIESWSLISPPLLTSCEGSSRGNAVFARGNS